MLNRKRLQQMLKIMPLGVLLFANAFVVPAQTTPGAESAAGGNAAKIEYKDLKVTRVWGVDDKTGHETDESNGLYNAIIVEIGRLYDWAKQEGNDASKLILYLDGYPLKGIPIKIDQVTADRISYVLFPRDATEQEWKNLLGRPHSFKRAVDVTVGLENHVPLSSNSRIKLTVLSRAMFWAFLAALIVLIGFFVWLARASDVLRDAGPQPAAGRKTFSLGRTQMAFWFFMVVASYAFIFLVTSAYGSLPGSVLALIGISAGTALASAVIDTSKRNAAESELKTLALERATLKAEESAAHAATGEHDARKTRLAQIEAKIAQITGLLAPQDTQGFFHDILSDANGISFHRFQIAVWTVVLGFIFIAQVYNLLSMPDFPETLLALMGISGGTYLGFKFPEQQT